MKQIFQYSYNEHNRTLDYLEAYYKILKENEEKVGLKQESLTTFELKMFINRLETDSWLDEETE